MLITSDNQNIPAHHQRGFTLIELMITIAIIGILATIALFAYRDYIIRTQVSEGLTLVSGAELALAEWTGSHPNFPNVGVPNNNVSLGLALPASISGKYVDNIAVNDGGKIELTFGHSANTAIAGSTKKCILSPLTSVPGAIRWKVDSCGFEERYLPQAWRQ